MSALLVVDQLNQELGVAIDPLQGIVLRRLGTDLLTFAVPTTGFVPTSINLFHASPDCGGLGFLNDRYVMNFNGVALAYFAQFSGVTAFYTKLVDPNRDQSKQIWSYEVLDPGQNPSTMGMCYPYPGYYLPVGAATIATDSALAVFSPPFHIK